MDLIVIHHPLLLCFGQDLVTLSAIDYTQKRVGVIQFFFTNTFELSSEDGATRKLEYVCLCTVDEKVP